MAECISSIGYSSSLACIPLNAPMTICFSSDSGKRPASCRMSLILRNISLFCSSVNAPDSNASSRARGISDVTACKISGTSLFSTSVISSSISLASRLPGFFRKSGRDSYSPFIGIYLIPVSHGTVTSVYSPRMTVTSSREQYGKTFAAAADRIA